MPVPYYFDFCSYVISFENYLYDWVRAKLWHAGFSLCRVGSSLVPHRLSSCGVRARFVPQHVGSEFPDQGVNPQSPVLQVRVSLFLSLYLFVFKNNCFTILCLFLLYNIVNQL